MPELSIQETMEKIFPRWREYPQDSMTPSVSEFGNKKVVSFLVMANDDYLKEVIQDPHRNIPFKVSTTTEPSLGYCGTDIVVGLEFIVKNPKGNPFFQSVIYGDTQEDIEKRTEFCKAMQEVDNLFVFIAKNDGTMIALKQVAWDSRPHDVINHYAKNGS